VAGREDILQEVQRERLVGQHGAGERGPLGGGSCGSLASRLAFCSALRWK
jgi:hypothetical protein